jgi:hypothetical protein
MLQEGIGLSMWMESCHLMQQHLFFKDGESFSVPGHVMRNQIKTYHSLQLSHLQALENLSRFVGMADVFKGLGGVLAAYV